MKWMNTKYLSGSDPDPMKILHPHQQTQRTCIDRSRWSKYSSNKKIKPLSYTSEFT